MSEPQKEYIITDELLNGLVWSNFFEQRTKIEEMVRSSPYTGADKVLEKAKDLAWVRIAQGISGLSFEAMLSYLSKTPEELQVEIDGVCRSSGMTEPHPLRCETCEIPGWVDNPGELGTCPVWSARERKLTRYQRSHLNSSIEKVADRCGLACHSSTTSAEKVLEDEDILYPIPSRENRIKIQSIAALLMNKPQRISNSANPSYILNHIGKALSYLMRNDINGDIEYKAIKNMMKLRQECEQGIKRQE